MTDKEKLLQLFNEQSYNIRFDLTGTDYHALENIGTGAYGVVCSALNTKTNSKVAIKKIHNVLMNVTLAKRTLREITILKHFQHENIIGIKDMFMRPGYHGHDVYIVLDLMETDLHQIIHSNQPLTNQHIQYFTYQTLRGLKYIHSANIIHRDLKPSNLMVNADCLLKIGDFGMARNQNDPNEANNQYMTQYVATRWYRAPELLFSMLDYSTAVDLWSTGCILAEMIMRRQLFPGKDHLSQLKLIIYYLGTPPKEVLQKVQSDMVLRIINGLGRKQAIPWGTILPKACPRAIDLISKLMNYAPWERITAAHSLEQSYLAEFHDPSSDEICRALFKYPKNIETLNSEALEEAIRSEVSSIHAQKNSDDDAEASQSDEPHFRIVPNKCAATSDQDGDDIQMLSAHLAENLSIESSTGKQEDPASTKVDVKNALLQVLEAKKQSETQKKPITAQSRHLEKLERRKRREHKQQRSLDGDLIENTVEIHNNAISEADRSLLDHWKQLREQSVRSKTVDPTIFSYATEASASSPTQTLPNTIPFQCSPELNLPSDVLNPLPDFPQNDSMLYRENPPPMGMYFGLPEEQATNYNVEFQGQIGDIISQSLPSFESQSSSKDSAQLMEDWLMATNMNPEELKDLEKEIVMQTP